jgi:hypothetical protein
LNEASIIINGKVLTEAQAITVRVGLNAFGMDLNANGMGEDPRGVQMKHLYLARLHEILAIIHEK